MSVLEPRQTSGHDRLGAEQPPQREHKNGNGHGGHSHWMMIACCIPMLVIAIVLVAIGVASPGFIVAAVACTAMMAMMMVGMSHGDGGGR